jgi:hypothetical protein
MRVRSLPRNDRICSGNVHPFLGDWSSIDDVNALIERSVLRLRRAAGRAGR